MSADEIEHGRVPPFVGHMRELKAEFLRQIGGNEVTLGPGTWRTVALWLRSAAQQCDKLFKGPHTKRRMRDHDNRRATEIRDMREIAHGIVIGSWTEKRSDDVRRHAGHNERVAVGLGAGNLRRGCHAAGAAAILDIDLLAEALGQGMSEDSAERVGASARRERDDQLDRA